MKKMNYLSVLLFTTSFAFQSNASAINSNLNNTLRIEDVVFQQGLTVDAYVSIQGYWQRGSVTIVDGMVTSCSFREQSGMRPKIYQKERPKPLNPNNPIAINNNFTHYIDIPNFGRAYFAL
jgi:hypothetical protein